MYCKHLSIPIKGGATVLSRAMLIGCVAFGSMPPASAEETKIVVVTSFPEELTTRYEQEFEKRHPDIHIQYVWKQARDALALLSKPAQGGADIYWTPSIGNFATLRENGAFQKITVDRAALPGRLGSEEISDPAGFFEAYDVAGYGVVMNAPLAASNGLAAPKRWGDLASPDYARHLAMPIPAKVGFSPALYDIFLQSEGWDAGWALLSEMAGEAALHDHGALPGVLVREGKAVFGLTIDFFAVSAKANGAPVEMIYPERTAFLPAHIAVTASTTHLAAARSFVEFALSDEGQRLMMERDSMRHPARPDAYRTAPAALVDPFKLPAAQILDYDMEIGRRRPPLVTLLFDLAIVEGHDELAALWRAIHEAARKGGDDRLESALNEARRRLSFIPVSPSEAKDPAFLGAFANRDAVDPQRIAKWRADIAAARRQAKEKLASVGVAP
jgi:phosphoglycerate transport regulatory protein PgtC